MTASERRFEAALRLLIFGLQYLKTPIDLVDFELAAHAAVDDADRFVEIFDKEEVQRENKP